MSTKQKSLTRKLCHITRPENGKRLSRKLVQISCPRSRNISFLKKCISCPPSGQCLISKLCQILCPESEESLIKKLEQTFHEVELETRKKFMSTQWKSLTRKL